MNNQPMNSEEKQLIMLGVVAMPFVIMWNVFRFKMAKHAIRRIIGLFK